MNPAISAINKQEKEEMLQQRRRRYMERISRRNAEETPEDREVRLHDRKV